jgi:hypothetical protein
MFIRLKKLFSYIKNFVKTSLVKKLKVVIVVVPSLVAFLVTLSSVGWLDKIYAVILRFIISTYFFVSLEFMGLSILGWIIIALLIIYLYFQSLKVNVVAGEFKDDFNDGLANWEFGGEGWKIEFEDDKKAFKCFSIW